MKYNNMRTNEHQSDIDRKWEIRKEIVRRLLSQGPRQREERSLVIQKKLLSCEDFRTSRTIMTYVSLPTEVDTDMVNREAMRQGKRVVAPYIGPDSNIITAAELTSIDDVEEGPFGIKQPAKGLAKAIPLKEIDLIVVPALAYDKKNMRLGRGKGYYDNFLASEDLSSATAIGLAFRFQILNDLPAVSHDRPVTRVITE
jgi:5-formyltetrahydrofolate cyclo-ligase